MSPRKNRKEDICCLCQDFAINVGHKTSKCPKLVCKMCLKSGHVSKFCPAAAVIPKKVEDPKQIHDFQVKHKENRENNSRDEKVSITPLMELTWNSPGLAGIRQVNPLTKPAELFSTIEWYSPARLASVSQASGVSSATHMHRQAEFPRIVPPNNYQNNQLTKPAELPSDLASRRPVAFPRTSPSPVPPSNYQVNPLTKPAELPSIIERYSPARMASVSQASGESSATHRQAELPRIVPPNNYQVNQLTKPAEQPSGPMSLRPVAYPRTSLIRVPPSNYQVNPLTKPAKLPSIIDWNSPAGPASNNQVSWASSATHRQAEFPRIVPPNNYQVNQLTKPAELPGGPASRRPAAFPRTSASRVPPSNYQVNPLTKPVELPSIIDWNLLAGPVQTAFSIRRTSQVTPGNYVVNLLLNRLSCPPSLTTNSLAGPVSRRQTAFHVRPGNYVVHHSYQTLKRSFKK
jgi:hypothetical protein